MLQEEPSIPHPHLLLIIPIQFRVTNGLKPDNSNPHKQNNGYSYFKRGKIENHLSKSVLGNHINLQKL